MLKKEENNTKQLVKKKHLYARPSFINTSCKINFSAKDRFFQNIFQSKELIFEKFLKFFWNVGAAFLRLFQEFSSQFCNPCIKSIDEFDWKAFEKST